MELSRLNISHKTNELREMILSHPDLPIVVLAGESANVGDYPWMFCESVRCEIGEILDCDYYDYGDVVFTDRDRLVEYMQDYYCDEPEYKDMTDKEYEKMIEEKAAEFEQYWRDVIFVYVDN